MAVHIMEDAAVVEDGLAGEEMSPGTSGDPTRPHSRDLLGTPPVSLIVLTLAVVQGGFGW
jgi:hypothetical protein